jgi:hypothetical protein
MLRILIALSFLVSALAPTPSSAQVVIADAGEDLVLECSATGGAGATLDGLGSTVDGVMAATDPNTAHHWEATGVVFDDETSPTPNGVFPLGTTTVTLTLTHTDSTTLAETVATDTVDVSVGDTTPPAIAAVSDPIVLWPPNHKLREVEVDLVVTDSCDPDPVVLLTSLVSNEPDDGSGDGSTVDDIQEVEVGTDDRSFLLRAERSGGGSGRIYAATYNATDASGNSTDGVIQILVPHDRGDLKAAKAEAKAARKMAKAAEKAAKKEAKAAAKAAKKAAKAAKKAAKAAKKAAKAGS